jgi:hypothetical protein
MKYEYVVPFVSGVFVYVRVLVDVVPIGVVDQLPPIPR